MFWVSRFHEQFGILTVFPLSVKYLSCIIRFAYILINMLLIEVILGSSIALQATSAVLALRMIPVTRNYWAWISLALAVSLMAIRRIISFYELMITEDTSSVNTTAEITALIISILVLVGIIHIRPILEKLYAALSELENANHRLKKESYQRKLMEEEARWNEEKFRNLTEHSPMLIWMSDQQAMCTYFNQRWLEFRGRSLEAEKGMGWTQGLHLEDKEQTINSYLQAFNKRESFDLEYRLKNRNNEYRRIYDIGTPMYDQNNQFMGYIGSCIDITERARAEDQVRQSEQQKSLILQSMREKLVFLDTCLSIQWTNHAALELTGMNQEELKNRKCYKVWHQSDNPCFDCPAEKALRSGEVEESEIKFLNRIFNIRAYPVKENGHIKGILEAKQDITEKKQTEALLKQSEEKFRRFFQENNAIQLIINPETGRIISANRSAKKYYGYENPESMYIQNINQLSEKDIKAEMKQAFLQHKNFFHFQHKLANGEIRHVEAHSTPLEINHNKFLYSIIHDITDRINAEKDLKKSEEKFRNIVNTLPQFVSYTDKNLIYRFVNQTYLDRFNLKEEDIVGKSLIDIIGKESYKKAKPHIDKALKGKKVYYKEFFNYPNNIQAYMEAILIPAFDTHNQVAGYYAILSDVTHHIKNQELLENSRNKLRSLSEYQQNLLEEERKFIAREIHDELGQNLTAIRMGLTMLKKQIPRTDRKVFSKLKELNQITQNTFDKIKLISTELRPQLMDHMGLTAAVEWFVQQFEKSSGIAVRTHFLVEEEFLPEKVAIQLYRIIQEAMTNVYKHAQASTIEISLQQKNNCLYLNIKDDGKGIRKADTQKKEAYGIKGIEERIQILRGTFHLDGNHKGTTISIEIPL